ncbi:MAG: hypothetical protein IKB10_01540 [Alphaproteobacteria bacterium]|nr:hypothetical protein [Alphaproteobacteria bacterium]
MKVKNIAFSGFAAAILTGVCGAAQAEPLRLASQDYVDAQVEVKQDKVTAANAGEGITISVDDQGNLNQIGVNFDVVASNKSVTDKIGDAITSGDEFKEAVDAAIQGAVADGVVGETIDEKIGAKDALGNDVTLTTTAQTAYGAINELDAEVGTLDTQLNAEGGLADQIEAAAGAASAAQDDVDALEEQLNAEGGLVDDVEGLSAQINGENGLASKVEALETADHFTEAEADAKYAGIATATTATDALSAAQQAQNEVNTLEGTVSTLSETVATKADASALNNLATKQSVTDLETTLGGRLDTLEAIDHTQYATKTAVETAQSKADSAYELAETKQTAGQVESAINTKLAAENYMSGNNIGAGSYLMLSDGAGNITWSSIVVVDKDGNNVQLTSDAPSTGGSQEPAGV